MSPWQKSLTRLPWCGSSVCEYYACSHASCFFVCIVFVVSFLFVNILSFICQHILPCIILCKVSVVSRQTFGEVLRVVNMPESEVKGIHAKQHYQLLRFQEFGNNFGLKLQVLFHHPLLTTMSWAKNNKKHTKKPAVNNKILSHIHYNFAGSSFRLFKQQYDRTILDHLASMSC